MRKRGGLWNREWSLLCFVPAKTDTSVLLETVIKLRQGLKKQNFFSLYCLSVPLCNLYQGSLACVRKLANIFNKALAAAFFFSRNLISLIFFVFWIQPGEKLQTFILTNWSLKSISANSSFATNVEHAQLCYVSHFRRMKSNFTNLVPRALVTFVQRSGSFPAPLDKGNQGSGHEIAILPDFLSWKVRGSGYEITSSRIYTVEPVLSGPVLSGHPLLSGQLSKSRKLLPLITVILTSINRSRSPFAKSRRAVSIVLTCIKLWLCETGIRCFVCFLPEARGVATRDSGSGQVQSTKLDRTWVLLHFIWAGSVAGFI